MPPNGMLYEIGDYQLSSSRPIPFYRVKYESYLMINFRMMDRKFEEVAQ